MKLILILLAVAVVASAGILAGCGGEAAGIAESPVVLTITDVTMPDTGAVNQPVSYSATVRLAHTRQVFKRFALGRTGFPYVVTAYGESTGGGSAVERTEVHTGNLIFPAPGVYTVFFAHSEPAISKTVTIQ